MPANLSTSQDRTLQNTQRSKVDSFLPASKCSCWATAACRKWCPGTGQRIHKQNFQDDWCSTATCVENCAPCLSLSESHPESSAPCTGGSRQPSTTVCERLKPQLQTPPDIMFTGQLKLPWDGITDTRISYPWSRKIRSHTMSLSPAGFS